MTEPNLCPQCGSEIPNGSPAGLCPKCLVLVGLESQPPVDAEPQPTQPSPPAAPAGFVPPTVQELAARFPQLEIIESLGRGGMGAVYKARQTELDRLVAVKILPPEVSADPAFTERFTREARALARLSHPNIVAVYDFGRTADGLFYFVMEYVDGVNLRQAIQSGGMTPKDALAIVPQICDALQFAHDEGLVHRDIKPENILVDKKGRVKIADFGLAKLLGQSPGDVSLTGTQQVMGTLRYMAPEQMEGTKAVDHRADIYSLGVVFYELLTGELPIGRFAPPSKKVQIDVRLDEVVLRALETEPEQRYQHASEVKTEVEAISSTLRSSAPPDAPAVEMPPGRRGLRRRAGLLARVVLWTGGLVAASAFFWPWLWDRWPFEYIEHWDITLAPASGAYQSVTLSAERNLHYWGLRWDNRLLSKTAWAAQAKMELTAPGTSVIFYFDPALERWGRTMPGEQTPSWESEMGREIDIANEMRNSLGIDTYNPGVKEEAAELTRLIKDAGKGIAPGGRSPQEISGYNSRNAKVGSFSQIGEAHHSLSEKGWVGLPDHAEGIMVIGPLFLIILVPGLVIIVRRHRRRLAAAHEAEQRYRLGTIGFWVTVLCLIAWLANMELPWVRITGDWPDVLRLGAFYNWYGTVCVWLFFALCLFCFVTDFLSLGRRWQPLAIIVAGAVIVVVTGVLFWRLTGPATEQAGLVTTVGCSHEWDVGRWGWGRSEVVQTLEQRSGPGLQLAFAIGLSLLVLGCVTIRRSLPRRVTLLVTLAVWTGLLVGLFGVGLPRAFEAWWPHVRYEFWQIPLVPQSGAYHRVWLSGERRLYHWGQGHPRDLIAKRPWTGTAKIEQLGTHSTATLELDLFHEEWRWTDPSGNVTRSGDEPQPESVAEWMKASGIDVTKPGAKEEAAELIRLVKETTSGFLPGGQRPIEYSGPDTTWYPSGIKIGPFTSERGGTLGGLTTSGNLVGLTYDSALKVLAVLFLATWILGILIIVRRHRRRLAAAHEPERRYRLGTVGFWALIICLLGGLATSAPWVLLTPTEYSIPIDLHGCLNWHGIVTCLVFLAVFLLCFLTDFFSWRRSWQPWILVAAGAIVVCVTSILLWGLTRPVGIAGGRLTTAGSWYGVNVGTLPVQMGADWVAKNIHQRSGLGLWIAFAMGLAILVLGSVAMLQARRRPAESSGPAGEKEPGSLAAAPP